MPITRTATGKLASHEHDSGTPFALADWVSSGPTLSIDVNGRLNVAPLGSGTNRSFLRYNPIPGRTKAFIVVWAQGADEAQIYPSLHLNDITEGVNDCVRTGSTISRAAGELFLLAEDENGATAPSLTQAIIAKGVNIDYVFRLFADGPNVRGMDDASGVAMDMVASLNVSGPVGVGCLNASTRPIKISRFFAMTDRYVQVLGVPAGGSAQLRKSDDTIWTSAAEVGGVATLDAFPHILKTGGNKIVVLDSGGAIVESLTPDTVWGGDEYAYAPLNTAPDIPTITTPTAGHEVDEEVTVSWDAAVDPEGDLLQYEGDYWDGAAWQVLFALQAGLTYLWNTNSLPERTDYKVRVRAFDGALYGNYDESGVFSILHPVWADCPPAVVPVWEDVDPTVLAPGEDIETQLSPWAYYRLDEALGAVDAQDTSGNGRHAPIGAGITAIAQPGTEAGDLAYSAASGEGTGIVAPLGDPQSTPIIHTVFSLIAVVNPSVITYIPPIMSDPVGTGRSLIDGTNRFICYPEHGDSILGGTGAEVGVGVAIGTNGVVVGEHSTGHTPTRASYEGDMAGWHHVAVVWDDPPGSTGSVRIYIDGVYAGDLVGTYREGPSTKSKPFLRRPLIVVSDPTTWIGTFQGLAAEIAIWDRALTLAEIQEHEAERLVSIESLWQACPDPAATVWSPC